MPYSPSTGDFIETWHVPLRGVLHNVPMIRIPTDALYDSLNVLVRNATLQPRPGLTLYTSTVLGARPVGAFNTVSLASGAFQEDAFQADTFQLSGSIPSTTIVAATTRKIWAFYGGVWNDITDTSLTALDVHLSRFTSIEIGGVIYTLHTNGADAPRQWDGTSPTVSVVAGSPPLWTDLANISDRIIGIVPPYLVKWGEPLALNTWPATNFRTLADTPDPLVAIRAFGTQQGVVLKSRSIWSAIPTGGSGGSAFRFELRKLVDGPASPTAVVDADGTLYYMTDGGRVGAYDGSSHEWVAEGIWPLINAELDKNNTSRIFGVLNPEHREVSFFYPRTGDGGELKGVATVILPKPREFITDHIAFFGRLGRAVSAGIDLRLGDNDVLVFTSADQRSYRVAGVDDAGIAITGHWQSGLVPTPMLEAFRLEAIETFTYRDAGYGSLTVRPVYSNMLDRPGGTLGPGGTVDLTDVPVKDFKGSDVRGRFFGVRYEFTTPITLQWHGARLMARKIEGARGSV